MANPNIVNVTTIYGNTNSFLVTSNSNPFATAVVSNPTSSNKIYKINTLIVANKNGSTPRYVTITLYSNSNLTGTNTEIASTVFVPADASLIIIDKNSSFYLLENKSIGVTAEQANELVVTCSWEEIS